MLLGRKYRVEFTPAQSEYAEQIGGACRAMWNAGLDQRRLYRARGAWVNYRDQAHQLAEAKTDPGLSWLSEVPGHCLQQALMDLDRACRDHGTWNVKFRSARRWSPSFRFPEGSKIIVERLNKKHARIKLPKLGWVKLRWSRELGGTVRSATVSRQGRHWFVSLLVEDGVSGVQHPRPGTRLGVDRGVKAAVATSEGVLLDRVFSTAGEQVRIRRLQQRLARQQRGSNRRKVTVAKLNAVYGRIKNRRRDFAAQTAHRLLTGCETVFVEDLRTKNMTATAKGTIAEPGRNVRQKAGLNRAILDKGWHLFQQALEGKARQVGGRMVKVNPAYTSQRCSACGVVDPLSRESQASYRCTTCGHAEHADVNAAKNILAAGLSQATPVVAVTGRGDLAVRRSVKRQPTTVSAP